jgi:hypothetical protein
MAKTAPKKPNLLDLIPVQTVEWEKKPDGTVFLKKPKVRNRFLSILIKRLTRLRTFMRLCQDSSLPEIYHVQF